MQNRQFILHSFIVIGLLTFAATGIAELPKPHPVDARFNNPWPAEWETGYRQRAEHVLGLWKGQKPKGGTYGENEKNFYPTAMMAFLTGDRAVALKALQEPDNQAKDHAWTNGIDFYWCFTLKGQMRKYFYFGEHLDPAYVARFKDGAKKWTSVDPKTAKHPVYGDNPKGGDGWGPDVKGTCIDRRNTDNLRAMSDTSIYLMAEETGNEERRLAYKQRIHNYVATLYNIGMSEWDSPNYHGHAVSTYHNLYDFAKDPQTKLLAKAALDWLYTAAAVKYFRGGWGAPNARDYGGNGVFMAGATHQPWLYFGDTPQMDEALERDIVHHLTSSYRPPSAVVELARKNFKRPVEMLATKPPYKDWSPGKPAEPAFFETQFFGRTYQMGSAVSSDTGGAWNINCFKILASNSQRGVDYFVANTDSILGHSFKRPGDQVAQHRHLLIWLRPAAPAKTFFFQMPKSAHRETVDNIDFIKLEKTWIALRRISLSELAPAAGEELRDDKKKSFAGYDGESFFKAAPTGDGYTGFAVEIGEAPQTYDDFRKSILAKSSISVSGATVALKSGEGLSLSMTHNKGSELPAVERDGVKVDYAKIRDVYDGAAVKQAWMSGVLRVEAGGRSFTGTLRDMKYDFKNE